MASASPYREFGPTDASPLVVCGWERIVRGTVTVLPDGCVDLVWVGQAGLFVAGPDRSPIAHTLPAGTELVGVRLRPGTAGSVLGCPADEVPSGRSPLEAIWGRWAHDLSDRLAEARDGAERRALLERAVAQRARSAEPDRLVVEAIATLGRPGARVAATAEAVFLGSRQLERRFRQQVGYGPKVLDRVLRFRRFLAQADAVASGRQSLATAAAQLGYADQSHLTRECVRLGGRTPSQLVALWR